MKSKSLAAALILFSLAALLYVGGRFGLPVAPSLLLTVRWLATAALIVYAIHKRSLTTWILISMVIGAEIGRDLPRVAVNLRVLSQIFLSMIKVIIAPL